MDIRESKLVLLAADLAGYARASASLDALVIARFLDGWYGDCAQAIKPRGGRIVKFMGDAVLAVFPEDHALAAVEAASDLRARCAGLAWQVDVGVNVHTAIVAEGELGPDGDRRYDVLGSGVNDLFLMGAAAGIRITEAIYRQLPAEQHAHWQAGKTIGTYTRA
jgi:adenylate cyclase